MRATGRLWVIKNYVYFAYTHTQSERDPFYLFFIYLCGEVKGFCCGCVNCAGRLTCGLVIDFSKIEGIPGNQRRQLY